MAVVEIPLSPEPQRFTITLADVLYRMRVTWNDVREGGWTLDIGTQAGAVLLAGIPLLPNVDLLAQHAHLGIGGRLILASDRPAGEAPAYADLGVTARLFFVEA